MKIFIIAGEASGDLHGSNLMRSLLDINRNIQFEYWGGDKMKAIAPGLKKHYKELAFMGLVEVLMNIRTIKKNFKLCKQQIEVFQPDIVLFVDYPGFNLRMAKWVKSQRITTYHYIAPTVWAWHKSRIDTLKKYIDKLFVILPFEKKFFNDHDYQVEYVGNPILDEIEAFQKNENFVDQYKLKKDHIIAILPGSRVQEIKKILPILLSVSQYYPELIFCVAAKSSIDAKLYKDAVPKHHSRNIRFIIDDTYNLLSNSKAALVASGTATLETALFDVPQVVCYKVNAITIAIAKRIVDVKYISLVNLILDKPAIKELIQGDLTKENLKMELNHILGFQRPFILKDYENLRQKVGEPGASEKVAKYIMNNL